jgi:uncharacterized repeat protein (TIGR01451 family)
MKTKVVWLRQILSGVLWLAAPGLAQAAVATSTDLAIGKRASLTTALVGDTVVFQIGITNLGTNAVSNISGSDVVPSGFAISSWNSSGSPAAPVYNVTNGNWMLAALSAGLTASLNISTIVTNAGTYTNTALISGASLGDPNPNNNTSRVVVVTATQPADLLVSKTAEYYGGGTASHFQVGDAVTFTITISNLGPGIPFNIAGRDIVPPGFSVFGWSSSGPQVAPFYDPASGVWTLGTLYPTNFASLAIFATAVSGGTFTNTATITGASVSDPNTINNSSGVVVTVAPPVIQADLAVTKTASSNSIPLGAQVVFRVIVRNFGPNDITNALVTTDCLPPGLQYVTDSTYGNPTNGTYSPGTCSWTLPNGLAAGQMSTLQITAQATARGQFTNTASVAVPPGLTDPNPANNSSSAVVAVTSPAADLAITKTASTNSVKFGQQVVFRVALQDLGPSDVLTNIVVTDCLPPGFQYVTDSTVRGGGTGTYSPGTCQWTLPAGLATNATISLYITAQATNTGTFTNTATVIMPAGFTDPSPNNNTSSALVTVTPLVADLAVTKTVFTNTMQVFSTFGFYFTLTVTNLGPDTVTNLTLTDLLPAGLPFSGVVTNVGSLYTPSNGLWTVTGPLAAGQGATIALVGLPANVGTFTNTLRVNVPPYITDPNTNNNSAGTVVYVLPLYRILGYVVNCSSNGLPLANVTITLSGAATLTTTSMVTGNFNFNSVSNGTYTLTPSQPGNVFVPPSAVVTVSNAWVTVPPFVGSIGLIYGQVTYFGSPVTNHPITLAGGGLARPRQVFTDLNGNYIFTNTPVGNYTVTPVQTNGYNFNPTNAAIVLNAANCAAVTNFAAAAPRVVQLVALEVVQVIQNWSNTIPLIQNKQTWVRAHLQLTNPARPVLVQGGRLYGAGPGGALPGSPLSPFNNGGTLLVQSTNAAAGRGQLNNSLNFRLPPAWLSGAISLKFVATNNLTVVPTNTVPANSTVSVSFTPSRPLPLVIYPVNWRRAADGNLQQNSAANLADLPNRLLSMYPVPLVDSTLAQPLLAPFTAQPVDADYTALNRQLAGIRDLVRFFVADNRLYHGAVARGGPGIPATGEASLPGFISSALMPNNDDYYVDRWLRHLASHEIGHNLGRQHDISNAVTLSGPCDETAAAGTPVYPFMQRVPPPAGPLRPALGPMTNGVNALVYGLDTLTRANAPRHNPVADPNFDFDVMGYCDHAPLQWWISASTYPEMLRYITNSLVPPAPLPPPGPPRRWLFVRGPVDFSNNTGGFLPFYTLNTTSGYIPLPPEPGNYALRLFDGLGNFLSEIPFTPDQDTDETLGSFAAGPATGSFDIPILASSYPTAIERVELWENGGLMLARQVAGPSPPQFTGSLTVAQTSNSIHLAWSSVNAVAHAIQYSTDGGANWNTLGLDWPNQSYDLDPDYLSTTTNGIFRVIATDGFNSSEATNTVPVKVAAHRPSLILNSPTDGSLYVGDQQIILDASANDMQDGLLSGASLQWTSSRDGFLGYGKVLNLQADNLTEGRHVVTVTAIDSLGLGDLAAVQIFVLRQPQPELSLVLSGGQALLSWLDNAGHYLLESASDLNSGNWTIVTNAPLAADAQITVTLDLPSGSRFFRLRMP